MLERHLTVAEIHHMTGYPVRTIYRAMERGDLPKRTPYGCERGYRATESDVQRWLEGRAPRDR